MLWQPISLHGTPLVSSELAAPERGGLRTKSMRELVPQVGYAGRSFGRLLFFILIMATQKLEIGLLLGAVLAYAQLSCDEPTTGPSRRVS